MITAIHLKNFKCFKDETTIPANKFNLLTGINARGKSTALQALLLCKQSIDHDESTTKLYFNGTCVDLGTFDDVRNNQTSAEEAIEIGFNFTAIDDEIEEHELNITYFLSQDLKDDMCSIIYHVRLKNNDNEEQNLLLESKEGYFFPAHLLTTSEKSSYKSQLIKLSINSVIKPKEFREELNIEVVQPYPFLTLPLSKIHYISADRLGPQEFHLKTSLSNFPNVGVKGEKVANILLKTGTDLVNEKLYIAERTNSNKKNISKDILTQTAEWINKIFDGGNIQLEDTKSRIANILFNSTGKAQDKHNKPSNVGFGFSYALPIIVSGLIAKEGEILIVENPEAHLHPRAQSRITKFLAQVSSCGVQVFIETHSDHILNASRITVLDKVITNEELNILYFKEEEGAKVVKIPVKEDGGIELWPDGFFDQTDKDYERLFGI